VCQHSDEPKWDDGAVCDESAVVDDDVVHHSDAVSDEAPAGDVVTPMMLYNNRV